MNDIANPYEVTGALPASFDVDFAAPEFLADPWPPLLMLQQHDPVFWSAKQKGWIVTRFEDVRAGLSMDDKLTPDRVVPYFEQYGEEIRKNFPYMYRYTPKWVATMDPPAHTRMRQLFTSAFHKRVIDRERVFVREMVTGLLDVAGQRGEFDFVSEIGSVIPSRVICHLLGISEQRRIEFVAWGEAALGGALSAEVTPQVLAAMDNGLARMSEIIIAEIEHVRVEPRNDMLTALVQARYENDRLSDDELVASCQLIFAAGFDTTMHMLSNGLIELAAHPEACDYMLAAEANVPKVVNELMRHVSLIKSSLRMARRNFAWHGKTIKKNDLVFLMNGTANRDPAYWKNPEQFDCERDNSETLGFGHGIHHCVGHLLAKMELSEFFTAAFARFDVEILPGDRGYTPSYSLRSMSKLPVRFTQILSNREKVGYSDVTSTSNP